MLYTRGTASIDGLNYNTSLLPAPIAGLDFTLMSQSFSGFSDLRQRYATGLAGANVRITPNLVFNGTLEYRDYRDEQPYLFDTTGKRWTGVAGITWMW